MAITGKKILLPGEVLWTVSNKDGKFNIYVGPDPLVDLSEDEIPLLPDPDNLGETIVAESVERAIQKYVTVKNGEYIILHNPADVEGEKNPNGNPSAKKNAMQTLRNGEWRVITKLPEVNTHFPLWPGQWFERLPVHKIGSDEYLMVEVAAEVDPKAPYYPLTVQCAGIKKAMVDQTVDSKRDDDEVKTTSDVESAQETESDQTDEIAGEDDTKVEKSSDTDLDKPDYMEHFFKPGQWIIIPGNLTQEYIPPTGIKVVREKVEEKKEEKPESTSRNSVRDPKSVLSKAIMDGRLTSNNYMDVIQKSGLREHHYEDLPRYFQRFSGDDYTEKDALNMALTRSMNNDDLKVVAEAVTMMVQEREPFAQKPIVIDGLLRKAIVLGPTEFCVLLDEEGSPTYHEGPGRVFPGPYDTIRYQDSRAGVYDAYHIRANRGILLRVVSKQISREDLLKHLPKGVEDQIEKDGKESYQKGDEVFIGGVDAYLVPHSSYEVIDPETRKPHIGNDHSNVYVTAKGVDQKSGIYMEDVETGNIKLEKGEGKFLLDPRRFKHKERNIPGWMWDLLIAHTEPHKKNCNRNGLCKTPWALSVPVPNNEALMITSKDGRRVEVGPKTVLFEFEEVPEVMYLSTGKKKSDDNTLPMCFLRVKGNKVSDSLEFVTNDKVPLKVNVQYDVEFVGEGKAREKWFNHKDYVGLFTTSLRSRVSAIAETKSLMDIADDVAGFIRDCILGVKGKEDDHRPGFMLEDINMQLNDVDVLGWQILNDEVKFALDAANTTTVTRMLEDKRLKVELDSDKLRKKISDESDKITIANFKRDAETAKEQASQDHERDMHSADLQHKHTMKLKDNAYKSMQADQTREDDAAERMRKRTTACEQMNVRIKATRREATLEFTKAMTDVQKTVIETEGKIDVEKLTHIQPQLIKAIEGLGEKQFLAQLAQNLPAAGGAFGFLTQSGGIGAIKKLLEGTKFSKVLDGFGLEIDELSGVEEGLKGDKEE